MGTGTADETPPDSGGTAVGRVLQDIAASTDSDDIVVERQRRKARVDSLQRELQQLKQGTEFAPPDFDKADQEIEGQLEELRQAASGIKPKALENFFKTFERAKQKDNETVRNDSEQLQGVIDDLKTVTKRLREGVREGKYVVNQNDFRSVLPLINAFDLLRQKFLDYQSMEEKRRLAAEKLEQNREAIDRKQQELSEAKHDYYEIAPREPTGYDPATGEVFDGRPRKPKILTGTDENDEALTAHHLYPWNKIREDLNKALKTRNKGGLQQLFQFGEVKVAAWFWEELKKNPTDRIDDFKTVMDEAVPKICWSPQNVFMGPQPDARGDDPHEKLDVTFTRNNMPTPDSALAELFERQGGIGAGAILQEVTTDWRAVKAKLIESGVPEGEIDDQRIKEEIINSVRALLIREGVEESEITNKMISDVLKQAKAAKLATGLIDNSRGDSVALEDDADPTSTGEVTGAPKPHGAENWELDSGGKKVQKRNRPVPDDDFLKHKPADED